MSTTVTLQPTAVDRAGTVRVGVPADWTVETGPPLVALPDGWDGEPPAVVVSHEEDGLAGEDLATAVLAAAATRLTDPLVADLRLAGDDVEIVVAHHNRGVGVTTVERHHVHRGGRWIVGVTAADTDLAALAPLMHGVAASLVTDP